MDEVKIMSQQHTVFYDAQCPLCQNIKKSLRFLDRDNCLRWIPVQEVRPSTRQKARTFFADMEKEIYVLTKHGHVLVGFPAIREILSSLPSLIWVAVLMRPAAVEAIGQIVYQFVSHRRHAWFGQTEYIRPDTI